MLSVCLCVCVYVFVCVYVHIQISESVSVTAVSQTNSSASVYDFAVGEETLQVRQHIIKATETYCTLLQGMIRNSG
jgi:hypothetical protein